MLLRINLILLAAFVLGMAAISLAVTSALQENATREVLAQAGLMLDSAAAIRSYTETEIGPLLDDKMAAAFLPQSVPFYAATQNFLTLHKKHPDYAYKEATLNRQRESLARVSAQQAKLNAVKGRIAQRQRAAPCHVTLDLQVDDGVGFARGGFAGAAVVVDHLAQVDQLVLALPLIHQKEHIDPVQRIDRLHRDVFGIAGTDANDQ